MDRDYTNFEIPADLNEDQDLLIRVFVALMKSFVQRLHSFQERHPDNERVERLIAINDEMIRAESSARKIPLNREADAGTVHDALLDKNALPLKSCMYCAFLFADPDETASFEFIEEVAIALGGLIMIIDDLSDLDADIHDNQWNSCHLELLKAEKLQPCPRCGSEVCPNHVLSSIKENDIVQLLCDRLVEQCRHYIELCDDHFFDKRISSRKPTLVWLYGWMSLPPLVMNPSES